MRKVTYAKFHQSLFIPGIGTLGDSLPSPVKAFDTSMETSAEGLYIKINTAEAIVPWANVVLAKLAAEEKSSKK